MSEHDVRLQQLQTWLAEQLPSLFAAREWGAVPEAELTPASSDASFRRYFRWQAGERSLILMDAPPPQENCEPFVRIAALLASAGVHVPEVLAADLEQGFGHARELLAGQRAQLVVEERRELLGRPTRTGLPEHAGVIEHGSAPDATAGRLSARMAMREREQRQPSF